MQTLTKSCICVWARATSQNLDIPEETGGNMTMAQITSGHGKNRALSRENPGVKQEALTSVRNHG